MGEPLWTRVFDLDDLSRHPLRDFEHFFSVYKDLGQEDGNSGVAPGCRSASHRREHSDCLSSFLNLERGLGALLVLHRSRLVVTVDFCAMQRLFRKNAGEEGLAEFDPGQLAVALEEGEWLWLDLTNPSDAEMAAVGRRFGLDSLNIIDVMDVTLLPKVDDRTDYVLVVLHAAATGDDQRLSTEEMDFFIGDRFLVTAHRQPMDSIELVAQHVQGSNRLSAAGPAGLAAAIAEISSRRYFPLLDALDERIEELEDHAIAADPHTLSESQALRRDVILLRRILGPQRDVLRQLSQSMSPVLESSVRAFGNVYDHYFRLVEALDAGRGLLAGVLDTYRGAVAERTNEVMKVLTVFSAILLPLALIAGLWGMNFSDLPGSGLEWGFVGLLGIMAAIAIGLWVYFAWRGFVGGPKLRDLPKSVGLGLVHIGLAPLRMASVVRGAGLRDRSGTNHGPRQEDLEDS